MFDLEAALVEFERWGTGSYTKVGRPTEHKVLRLSDDGYRHVSSHPTHTEATDALTRARLNASIKAALGQSQEAV
ncbi:hypothetical protein C7441_112131 [Pseudaminobacter salicylatoxidans]|uniref:Uncharacterized protein n=1 Tax=Pseudaminobacter salicylatoxidans TaxID=93369 RepID=A0A316CLD9_PSESE|nr:hypothetical protein [Pseudaminobacter salicylatoxidans]PWJ80589.1 hypothetical protein C7441_112131 [Pseudaminobacter salicylatoxidans]